MTLSPASGGAAGGRVAGVARGSPSAANTVSVCSPTPGGGVCGPARRPSSSKKPLATFATTPSANTSSRNESRDVRCSFRRMSEGFDAGVHTMPRCCASSDTSSIVIVANSSSYSGLRTVVAISNRPTKLSNIGSWR